MPQIHNYQSSFLTMPSQSELLSPLTRKQQGLLNRVYTSLKTNLSFMVDARTNLIINDVGLIPEEQTQVASFISNNLVFLDPTTLTTPLQERLDSLDTGTLFVFPKNGALPVKDNLTMDNLPTAVIKVKRDPKALLFGRIIEEEEQLMDMVMTLKPERIEIVDDVIAKGSTVAEIRRFTQERANQTFLWSTSCWLMSFPEKWNLNPSGISYFDQSMTSMVYAGVSGRQTPLNSLSTWFFDDEKGKQILYRYTEKYAQYGKGPAFIDFINQLADQRTK